MADKKIRYSFSSISVPLLDLVQQTRPESLSGFVRIIEGPLDQFLDIDGVDGRSSTAFRMRLRVFAASALAISTSDFASIWSG
jgi:hypothetical protein